MLDRIAERLRCYRQGARLTQEQLAERAQIQPETISRLENGRQQPSVGMLCALSGALRVGVGDLIDEDATADTSRDEAELVERFRELPASARQGLLEMLRGL